MTNGKLLVLFAIIVISLYQYHKQTQRATQETCTFGTQITIHTIENNNLNIVTIKKRATWDGQHAQLYCNVSDIQTETYFNFIHNHHHHHALLAAFLHLLPTTTTYDRQP